MRSRTAGFWWTPSRCSSPPPPLASSQRLQVRVGLLSWPLGENIFTVRDIKIFGEAQENISWLNILEMIDDQLLIMDLLP